MERKRHLDAARAGPDDRQAHGSAVAGRRARVHPRPHLDRLPQRPDGHRVLRRSGNGQSARIRAYVERQDVERNPRLRRLHGASVDVDPSGRSQYDPRPGATRERREIDGQVRLGVRPLQEPRHHAGIVVPLRRRHERHVHVGKPPGREVGQDVEVGVAAAHEDEPLHGRAGMPWVGAEWPAPPAVVPLRTGLAGDALRTNPAGSGTERGGGAAVRSARARGPRPETGRSAPRA